MLRITISRDSQAAISYYDQALSVDDHYYMKKEVGAKWSGMTAALLGLKGKVTKRDFAKLSQNIHPKTGERLTVRNATNRRAGYDLTFNAPKSVTILHALTEDPEILKAHRFAVREAMKLVEADMQTQANQFRLKHYQNTGNIIYAAFDHFTTRPIATKGDDEKLFSPDPHLHTHAYIFNATWNDKRKRFQAIEMGTIHSLAPWYEAAYHSFLSNELVKAGYPIEQTADRWEIKGIDRTVINKFSRRTLEIEKVAKEKGIKDAKTKAELGARTRVKKNKGVEDNRLIKLWKARLTKNELFHLHSIKGAPISPKTLSAKSANEKSLKHHLERKSAVPEKRVLAKALTMGYGTLLPKDVQKDLEGRNDILSADKQSIKYITTKTMVRAEDEMLELAAASKGTVTPINNTYQIKQDFLSSEQRDAVQLLLKSNDRINILIGAAGVGKSTLLTEYKTGVEEAGKKVLAFAPSAAASRGVLQDKGFEGADTIASLLVKEEIQKALKDNVLLLDEAGMVGTNTMLDILKIAEKQNARIVLSGDPKQHSSILAGDALRQLREQTEIKTATVNTVRRQQKNESYRSAIQAMAEGNTLKGFDKLDKMNAIIAVVDKNEREARIANDYISSLKAKRTALVVSPTHAEGQDITNIIRAQMKKESLIIGNERAYPTLQNRSFTEVQKQDATQYEPGNSIWFHQNVKGGFKAGKSFEVLEKQTVPGKVAIRSKDDDQTYTLPFDEAKKFEVFQKQETLLAKGDMIRVSRNGKTIEASKIHNGQTYTVQGFTREGNIKLSNGKTLDKNFQHFNHGHVSTSYGAQGKDAQDVFLAQSNQSLVASNEKQFYVSASRGKERAFIYCEDKEELRHSILRNTDRMSAKEVADQHHQRVNRQRRIQHYQQELKRVPAYEKTTTRQPEHGISKQGRSLE